MKKSKVAISFAAWVLIVGCGSVETVDSAQVPYKSGNSSPTPIQDVYQAYSLAYSQAKNKTFATAQFRINSQTGDTIRYSNPDQVKFRGKSLEMIDGDKTNKTIEVMSLIFFGPILHLFKSGTFYQAEHPGVTDGVFEFQDDLGHRSEIEAKIPRFVFKSQEPNSIEVLEPTSPFIIDIQTLEDGKAETIYCTLASKSTDPQGNLKSTSNFVSSPLSSDSGQCIFSKEKLMEHRLSTSDIELIVELRHSDLKLDSNGRKMRLTTLQTWNKKLPIKPKS
jgi:hypothetical protein